MLISKLKRYECILLIFLKYYAVMVIFLQTLIGMAADVGTLQRLPKVIGSQSLVRDLCFTARKLMAEEALRAGLVSEVFNDKERYEI